MCVELRLGVQRVGHSRHTRRGTTVGPQAKLQRVGEAQCTGSQRLTRMPDTGGCSLLWLGLQPREGCSLGRVAA